MVTAKSPQASNTLSLPRKQYRPEIDGLRAFAVIAVIINHFDKNLLPSGYLGVDIFFVISGYVITSSLASRQSKNFLEFVTGFYERRITRLVPALLVFVLVTSILVSLFNPDPSSALGIGWKSLFGISNISLFRSSTDYFAQSTELNSFTHTWSLGVEEQFYLLFPFLIWFSGFGQQTAKGARNLFFWVGALTIASLIGFIYLYQHNQPAAYFLMPPRFWEMAAGCLIFIGFQKRVWIEQRLEQVPPLLVVAAMVGVMFLPVSAAVPATIVIVVLSAVLVACLKQGTAAYHFFTLDKVVFLGVISYSLYLWHWAVLSISRWTIGIHWWSVPFQAGLMLALSFMSWKYVETPMRRSSSKLLSTRKLPYALLLFSYLCGLGLKIFSNRSDLLYLGESDQVKQEQDMSIAGKSCIYEGKFPPCSSEAGSNDKGSLHKGRQLIIVGDSHAQRHVPLAKSLTRRFGIKVSISAVPAYPFPPNQVIRLKDPQGAKAGYEKQMSSMRNSLGRLKRGDILTIVNSGSYSASIDKSKDLASVGFEFPDKNWKGDHQTLFFARLSEGLKEISSEMHAKGVYVIYFLPNPIFSSTEISECFPQWYQALNFNSLCSEQQSKIKALSRHEKTLFPVLKNLQNTQGLLFFSPSSALCSANLCKRIINGKQVYTDGSHLTIYGSQLVFESFSSFLIKSGILEDSGSDR